MIRWQKRARLGIATFGIVVAIVVYAAIGERQTTVPANRLPGVDPRAIIESVGATFHQFQEARQDYVIEADRQLTYEGGATKFLGVNIKVNQRAGRDFVVSGREAQAGSGQKEIEITGDVKLAANDGFVATTDHATFREADATVRAAGQVAFHKGRMTGSGIRMTYDQSADLLVLGEQARVTVTDDAGTPTTEFSSNSATLSRVVHELTLEGSVHALRGKQVIEAERSKARLSADDEDITFIELRGAARVIGGDAFASMAARDIDLDYTDDGVTLERVVLTGKGEIVMDGPDGAPGRRFSGDSLDLTFAPDASLTRAVGRGNVRVVLPAGPGIPARTVTAQVFEATGEPGKSLTATSFDGQVEYREAGVNGRAPRVARSNTLRITLAGDAVTSADFTGGVTFLDQGLQASGAAAQYDPAKGTLRLSGTAAGGRPRVADAQIEIDANAINVSLEGRQMTANGTVKTLLHPQAGGRLPGLLQQEEAANISAAALDYQGGAGLAIYSGDATLWQGQTAIRADRITLDQARADLVASGGARSTIVFDTGRSVGRATEIRYDDAARTITYGSPPPRVPTEKPAPLAQLSGPQGDLQAGRIAVVLAKATSRADRLEAFTRVSVRLDTRVATGARLTYFADDERYVMTGVPTVPVTVREECRETTGRTVTFFKSSERIMVDGNEEVRTQSKRDGPCAGPPVR